MTATTTDRPAYLMSAKQQGFIEKLLRERDVPASVRDQVKALLDPAACTSKLQASSMIDALMKRPQADRVRREPATPAEAPLIAPAFFAIPVEDLAGKVVLDRAGVQSFLFGQVREWQGRQFIDTLRGAPGDWNRMRASRGSAEGRELFTMLGVSGAQLKYMELFNDVHEVCGKCGSPLSDDTSIAAGFGPDCRRMLGLAS